MWALHVNVSLLIKMDRGQPASPAVAAAAGRTQSQSSASTTSYGSMLGNTKYGGLTSVFPSVSLVFKSLSRMECHYEVNLEKMELLGDSFLKLATSVYLFCHPQLYKSNATEGRLSSIRMALISNATLYESSRRRDLVPYMFKVCKQPKLLFLPPLCHVEDTPGMFAGSKI